MASPPFLFCSGILTAPRSLLCGLRARAIPLRPASYFLPPPSESVPRVKGFLNSSPNLGVFLSGQGIFERSPSGVGANVP